ncbi:MAG: glycine cleavage system protein GcvH [Betaproteobacteria bacterium]|jgi:glycine cleavage system H protein
MTIPNNLKYAPSHEWALLDPDGSISVGITHHAQDALGDIVFLELPILGQQVELNQPIAVIESVKAASDIHAPLAGTITAINEILINTPEDINKSPYSSWLFKIAPKSPDDYQNLLPSVQYATLII